MVHCSSIITDIKVMWLSLHAFVSLFALCIIISIMAPSISLYIGFILSMCFTHIYLIVIVLYLCSCYVSALMFMLYRSMFLHTIIISIVELLQIFANESSGMIYSYLNCLCIAFCIFDYRTTSMQSSAYSNF